MLKVLKFGGSSMADAQQLSKVRSIVESDPSCRVVVVSAAGKRFKDDHKITDLLYLCHAHLKYGVSYDGIFSMIEDRFLEIQNELGLDVDLKGEFAKIRASMHKNMSIDYLVSRGEYLSGKLMAAYLGYDFVDATEWVVFGYDGKLDMEKSQDNLAAMFGEKSRVVLPGFYGALPDGKVRVMSRGGSDITGALAAAAIDAGVYENWTDVSGFLVSDPRIVDSPKSISVITYKELRELSYMGATVLHEDAIFPVRTAGIPINIKNTNRPEDAGTMIVSDVSDDELNKYTITGIAGKKGFAAINIEKAMMNSELGFCRKVLSILEDFNISIEHMPSGIDTLSLIFPYSNIEGKEDEVISKIRKAVSPDHIELEKGIAMLAVVGRGMRRTRGTAARIFASMAHARINVKMIDQGSSELNIIIGIGEEDFNEAIRRIYDMFINSIE